MKNEEPHSYKKQKSITNKDIKGNWIQTNMTNRQSNLNFNASSGRGSDLNKNICLDSVASIAFGDRFRRAEQNANKSSLNATSDLYEMYKPVNLDNMERALTPKNQEDLRNPYEHKSFMILSSGMYYVVYNFVPFVCFFLSWRQHEFSELYHTSHHTSYISILDDGSTGLQASPSFWHLYYAK